MTSEKVITSHSNPSVKFIKSLELKKNREAEKLFVAEGLRHVTDALGHGWQLHSLCYTAHMKTHELTAKAIKSALQQKAQCLEVSKEILEKLTSRDNAQSVIGVFHQKFTSLTELQKNGKLLIVLDNIKDPGNLGTILRTSDATAASGVILVGQTCDPFSSEAIRASMGSFARIPIAKVTQDEFLNWVKTWQGGIIGTHLNERTIDYRKADYNQPLLLVMGTEQSGLSPEMTAICKTLVKIPMSGGLDSLNLSIATAIMQYEIYRHITPAD